MKKGSGTAHARDHNLRRVNMRIEAAVVSEVGGGFSIQQVDLAEPAADEVLVEIAGVGICHTDVAVMEGHLPFPLPGVLGHEGSGTVAAVGSAVGEVAVGDKVAISFNSCGACPRCAKGEPAYCHDFMAYNFGGARADGSSAIAEGGRAWAPISLGSLVRDARARA
jgi:aryl-alcohol dehydrogenase